MFMKETLVSPHLILSEWIKCGHLTQDAQSCPRRNKGAAEEGKIYPGAQQEVKLGLL